MQSQSAHRIMRRGFERGSDQARGVGRSALSFTSARALETSVPNLARTPAQLTTMLLQDGARATSWRSPATTRRPPPTRGSRLEPIPDLDRHPTDEVKGTDMSKSLSGKSLPAPLPRNPHGRSVRRDRPEPYLRRSGRGRTWISRSSVCIGRAGVAAGRARGRVGSAFSEGRRARCRPCGAAAKPGTGC